VEAGRHTMRATIAARYQTVIAKLATA
jgi:hypothetical protein